LVLAGTSGGSTGLVCACAAGGSGQVAVGVVGGGQRAGRGRPAGAVQCGAWLAAVAVTGGVAGAAAGWLDADHSAVNRISHAVQVQAMK